MSRLYNILNAIINPFGKNLTLSNSNWTSGNCTVSGSSKYLVFLVYIGDQMCLAYRSDSHIYGYGASAASGGTVWERSLDISVNGDVWTYNYTSVIGHFPSSNHSSAITGSKIAKVIGLVPNWGGLKSPDFNGLCRFLVCEEVAA